MATVHTLLIAGLLVFSFLLTCLSVLGDETCLSADGSCSHVTNSEDNEAPSTKPVSVPPPPVTMERTFLMIKPDGVHRGLMSDIIGRFEKKGYKLVAMKFVQANAELLAAHYAEHEGKPFYEGLLNYIMSGPVLAMVWEGREVITTCRTIIGATNPLKAAPGTIRGDYGLISGRNIIHGSDSPESATREISLWFGEDDLITWQPNQDTWLYES